MVCGTKISLKNISLQLTRFLAKLFPQLCSCNWNGNCDHMNDKKVIIWHFCHLFSNYERQKGHNFPILWPFQNYEWQKGHNLVIMNDIVNDKKGHNFVNDGSRETHLQGLFGIIFSLFQWEILFSHIFAPLFCSFHYNRKWLHFEFHLISGIWRGRMCFLWLLSFIKMSKLWPYYERHYI